MEIFFKRAIVFSSIANVRIIKSDQTWFRIVQYRVKLSSAISSDLANLVQISILIILMFSQAGAKESNQGKFYYHIKVPPRPSTILCKPELLHKP